MQRRTMAIATLVAAGAVCVGPSVGNAQPAPEGPQNESGTGGQPPPPPPPDGGGEPGSPEPEPGPGGQGQSPAQQDAQGQGQAGPRPTQGQLAPGAAGESATGRPAQAASDERTAKNSIFAELLGPGPWYSVNYERMALDDLAARIGFMFMQISATAGSASSSTRIVTFPMTVSYIGLGSGKHSFEIGGGGTLAFTSSAASSGGLNASGSGATGWGNLLAGYRIQPRDGGFQFRIGVNMYIGPGWSFSTNDPTKVGVFALPYMSFGGTF